MVKKTKKLTTVILVVLLFPIKINSVIAEPVYSSAVINAKATITHAQLDVKSKTMDAASHDIDKDGDIDIILAIEFGQNIVLLNDGNGKFDDIIRFGHSHDSEDIGVADFNNDGELDIVFVSEDDKKNELYFNSGDGSFVDASNNLPVDGISNSVVVFDVNNDGYMDIIIGNDGANKILLNNGEGAFIDVTQERMDSDNDDVTQDLHLADVDNDGDLDLLEANEGQNKIYINNGKGYFKDETSNRLPKTIDESREVIVGDIDNDGDIDLYYANVQFSMKVNPADRLLINNSNGFFTDVNNSQFPQDMESNFTAIFIDLDNDGDLDVLTGSSIIFKQGAGTLYAYINNGDGKFYLDSLNNIEESSKSGNVFDINEADYNGDNINDMYIARRASQKGNGGQDILILR